MDQVEQQQEKKFNIQVTYRDERTGRVIKTDPYICRVIQTADGGKGKVWERPAGSGNLFNSKNEPIGRWVVDPKTKKGKHDPDAQHVKFTAPETADQKLARSLNEKDARIAELEKEMASIKSENKKKQGS